MGRVFKQRSDATEYAPVAGDTLATIIATKCEAVQPPITADEVALFNWGTKKPVEVNRALVELIGCTEVDDADPTKSKLDPARGPGSGKLFLPKVLAKTGLAYEKAHTVKVKQQLPATAIRITSLDKWFLPDDESCDVGYALEGLKTRAMKVDMDVYASNYAKATATNDGEFVTYAFADIPDTVILTKPIATDAAERAAATDTSWKGESEAKDGILKARTPAKRYVNAASSPYCVTLRYYKKDPAKKPVLRIDAFWPRWSGKGAKRAVVGESLKFKWTLKDCPAGMQGQFQISDKDGKIVWRQALPKAKCADGEHEHDWTDGKTLIAEDKTPYRVQIQVHTDKDADEGVGLAAMHTEVRLLTHPDIGTKGTKGVDHEQETQVLAFAQAPFYSSAVAPAEDSAKGRKLRLAKAGYHPGPVEDLENQPEYIKAVREFQRDHVKPASNPPERLKSDGTIDADTKTAIAAQAPDRRPLFADNARADITVEATLNTALNDKATPIVAWIDDRANNTEITATHAAHLLPNMGLEDYRGPMELPGDGKQDCDEKTTCRPWIPLEVAIPVMKKGDKLDAVNPVIPTVSDAMRNAVGPIRVDWTFRDLAPEYNVDTTQYDSTRVRSLLYLTRAIDKQKGTHNEKDAFNCSKRLGGLRAADYYKLPFGIDKAQSLMPWLAEADGTKKTVCSVAHDDLGQDVDRVYADRRGKAGIYFRPSIIGGDGYQLRAQISFADLPAGATHPNWKVLRHRYVETTLPQAHSAPIRLWRKDSYRGHVQWARSHHWGTYDALAATFYEPGMVHFVQEVNCATFTILQVFPGRAGKNAYRKLVEDHVQGGMGTPKTSRYAKASKISLTMKTIWPWSTSRHLGIQGVPASGTSIGNYAYAYEDTIFDDTWREFREPLVYAVLSFLERDHGLLRGHSITEFRATPEFWVECYYCSECKVDHLLIETKAAGGSGAGEDCRVGTCTGTLRSSIKEQYLCDQCGRLRRGSISKNIGGTACTTPCTGTMTHTGSVRAPKPGFKATVVPSRWGNVRATYTCSTCAHQVQVVEPAATAGAGAGAVCGRPCPRHGVMQPVPGSRTPQEIGRRRKFLNVPSWGGGIGGLFLDTTEGARTYWVHEIGHHKHLEHAGDVISDEDQHDRAKNQVSPGVKRDKDSDSRKWDRDCTMSYVNTETGKDRAYFCGKCLLKLRGWKVEGLADPRGNVAGP